MASDKERREVAATMRAISGRGVKDLTLGEVLNSILTGGAPRPTTEMAILANLADLLDRPTCKYVSIGNRRFGCSWCGHVVKLDYDVPVANETRMPFNYCSNCGAEVVNDD